jgi:two-component system LytT family response regulator
MKIFLLDDEVNSRDTVVTFLKKYIGTDVIIKEANSVASGLEMLASYRPDLAILDINLGDGTSFDILSRLDRIDFKIIFISAYDEYAIKAFKFNALDYILKPINPLEFQEAIKKVEATGNVDKRQLDELHQSLQKEKLSKLILKDTQAIHFVDIAEIIQCKSESNYTLFSIKGGSELIISKTLGEYEELLRGRGFFRSHRSHLINLHQIKKFDKREGGYIEMTNGNQVPLSRTKREIFLKLIERI